MPSSRTVARRSTRKTCHRCGRTGSHAFRPTLDGLYECTTEAACRARQRRNAGPRHDGRGRLARNGRPDVVGGAPAIAYVIGPPGADRDDVVRAFHEQTGMAVMVGPPDAGTLAAISTRDVKLIAVDGSCLVSVGFRNELTLRHGQPRLRSVPIVVYGEVTPPPDEVAQLGELVQAFRPG
jgi:hypothetical protein